MKKNLFLLFAIYFFVIQSWIISFLRNDTRFFTLGIINLGVIIVVILSYSYFENSNNKNKDEQNNGFKKEIDIITGEKGHKKQQSKNRLFILSLVFAIIAFFFFKGYLISNKIIIASGLGFLLFIGLFYSYQGHKHHNFLNLWSSKLYLFIFIIGIVLNRFDYNIPTYRQETAIGYIGSILVNNSPSAENNNYQTEEEIIKEEIENTNQNTGNISSTGEVYTDTGDKKIDKDYLNDGDLTILDAIRYLISENNIELDNKQNVKFRYISYSNPNYPYFKTAYMKKMIGTSTNPDKKIICQTYIVMKGIAKGREISTSLNSLQAYRDQADSIGELNGCEKNKYVSLENL